MVRPSSSDLGRIERKMVEKFVSGDKTCSIHACHPNRQGSSFVFMSRQGGRQGEGEGEANQVVCEAAMGDARKLVLVSRSMGHSSALQQSGKDKKGSAAGGYCCKEAWSEAVYCTKN